MTLAVDYTVKVGTIATKTDFTNRVAGFTISQPLALMGPSSHTATITLHNYDGALTPAEGGGTGTYANTDWFSLAVFIDCQVNSGNDAVVFHGLLDGFDIVDDGVTSTVTLRAVCALSYLGRAPLDTSISTFGFLTSAISVYTRLQNDLATGAILPPLGETGSDIRDIIVTGPPYYEHQEINTAAVTDGQTIADALTSQIMPSGLSLLWATRIDELFPNYATYHEIVVGQALNRQTETGSLAYATAQHFYLVESSPGVGEFVFADLDIGYNSDTLRNVANVTSANTDYSTTVANTASVAKYGTQALTLTSTLLVEDGDVDEHATNITNRQGTIRFAPRRVRLRLSQQTGGDSGGAAALGHLMDNGGGLWQQVTVTYTPTGATSAVTVECVIAGRTITASPADTTIALDLLPAADYLSFELDSDTLGVLDTNRLG